MQEFHMIKYTNQGAGAKNYPRVYLASEADQRIAELEKDRDFWKEAYEKECDRSYMLACDWWELKSTQVSDDLLNYICTVLRLTHSPMLDEIEALLAERKEQHSDD